MGKRREGRVEGTDTDTHINEKTETKARSETKTYSHTQR